MQHTTLQASSRHQRVRRPLVAGVVAALAALTMASPLAAAEAGAQIGDITRNGCVVTIPVTTLGAGTYTLKVWDDGVVIDETSWEGTEGGVFEVTWTITEPAGEAAPGVGFYTYGPEGTQYDSVDPWEYPASVADSCGYAGQDMTVTIIGSTLLKPGGQFNFRATGFWPQEPVTIEALSTPVLLDTIESDLDGVIEGTATIPSDFPVGEHTLLLTGQLSGLSISTGFTVEGAAEVVETPAPVTVQPRFTG